MTKFNQQKNTNSVVKTPYECQACGWIYPPKSDAKDNTDKISEQQTPVPFVDLPAAWQCPLCGVNRSEFKPVSDMDTTASNQSNEIDAKSESKGSGIKANATKNSEAQSNHIKSDVVIIGAGLAGWHVVDALRVKDTDISITMIAADNGDRYHKPMLSAAFSQNKTPNDLIRATGKEAAKKADINLIPQTSVLSIDSSTRIIETQSHKFHYNNLVLATGAIPAIPPSLPIDKIDHINDITNFTKLQMRLNSTMNKESKHIAVIGAGMVGTEISEDLTKAGHQVTLLDMSDAPLATILPPIATDKVAQALNNQGIEFLGGCRVTDLEDHKDATGNDCGYKLLFTDDNGAQRFLVVDHILVSTGLSVNTELAQSAGVTSHPRTGIIVNENNLQTNIEHIYAIGDCMSINGVPCRYVAPLRSQAAVIADALLGHERAGYQHKTPMIRLKNKSISVSATGVPNGRGNWQVVTNTKNEMTLKQLDESDQVTATATLKMS